MTMRPAVRVLCIDTDWRILMLRWRDPSDGSQLWEPPGGGIEPGEQAIDAARRELVEETGFAGHFVLNRQVMVPRDVCWNGEHYRGEEAFFLARVPDPGSLSPRRLEEHERAWLEGYAWVHWSETGALGEKVEPPNLSSILVALDPYGPWNNSGGP